MNENEIQRAIFKHFRQRGAPGVFAFHPKNGGVHQRGRRAGINSGLGVIPGVPDIIAIKDGKTFALELKTEKEKLRPAQEDVIDKLRKAGAVAGFAQGLDAALRWLESHGLLLGTSVTSKLIDRIAQENA